jgi:hypothetical protein
MSRLPAPKRSQNAAPTSQQQAQLNSQRRIMDNTRYKIGKKNAAGFYETNAGQYSRARALGAI